jgi:hypothetical protein
MRLKTLRALRALMFAHVGQAFVVLLSTTLPTVASAQATRPCVAFDSTASALSRLAVTLVSDTSSGFRDVRSAHGVPPGTVADVAFVQDNAVCEAATASLESKGWPHQSEAFVVVRIGQANPFYLVTKRTTSVMGTVYLMDSQFVVLTEFGGH